MDAGFPAIDFKVIDPSNPDDYGRRCRILIVEGRAELRVKAGKQFLSVGQARFPTAEAAIAWAQAQHIMGQLGAA